MNLTMFHSTCHKFVSPEWRTTFMPNITADDLNDVIYVLQSYRDKNKDEQIHIPVSTSVYLRPQLPSKTSSSSLESYPWRILFHQYQSPRELAIYKTM